MKLVSLPRLRHRRMMSASGESIRVLVIEDSPLVREGLRAVLGSGAAATCIQVVGEAGSVEDGILAARTLKPSVVLLDIRLPDGSGLKACKQICDLEPQPKVLILTSVATDELIREAIVAGAHGYLLKEINPPLLVQAIIDAAANRSVVMPEIAARMMHLLRSHPSDSDALSTLSPQERRVLALVSEARTNKEIGIELGLSEKTVKNYLSRTFEKLAVNRRAQAAAIYNQQLVRTPRPTSPSH